MRHCMTRLAFGIGLAVLALGSGAAKAGDIDAATVERWSQKFLGWHYWPEHVIPPRPGIAGFDAVHMTDCPTVFQIPGDATWYMSFIGFDGQGYQSFLASSDDLVRWRQLGLAMGAYGMALMLGEFALGQLSDRLGRKPVLIIGLVLFSSQFIGLMIFRNMAWIALSISSSPMSMTGTTATVRAVITPRATSPP